MNRTIRYAIEADTGLVYSRVGDQVAVPVLDYEGMTPANNFAMAYNLEKYLVYALAGEWGYYRWTRKIPTPIKNLHRAFWGMKPLKR